MPKPKSPKNVRNRKPAPTPEEVEANPTELYPDFVRLGDGTMSDEGLYDEMLANDDLPDSPEQQEANVQILVRSGMTREAAEALLKPVVMKF